MDALTPDLQPPQLQEDLMELVPALVTDAHSSMPVRAQHRSQMRYLPKSGLRPWLVEVGAGQYLARRFASHGMAPCMAPAVPSGLADAMAVDRLVVRSHRRTALVVDQKAHGIVMVVDRLVVRSWSAAVVVVVQMVVRSLPDSVLLAAVRK